MACPAQGTLITFDFVTASGGGGQGDGSPFDGGVGGSNGLPGAAITIGDLTATIVEVKAPEYAEAPLGTWTWNSQFVNSKTNIQGTNGLAIDNSSIGQTPSQNEGTNFSPGESLTLQLSKPVLFKGIVFGTWNATTHPSGAELDQARVEADGIGFVIYNQALGDPTTITKTDPFGMMHIPANTNITFTNTNAILASLPVVSGDNVPAWRISSLTFEIVPEPSSISIICIGLIGIGTAWRRRKK